ncbi:MAG: molecular chaperone DnaK [Abditibacteriales bacterium]|nr:molecular chaperone DnaK [Abditibacteriales bacterium]MDW8366684.1 molecular chaperone DnaK [Abditibacteriales bacterium]
MPKAVGIDLGTTNSVVAVVESAGAEPTVIPSAEGGRLCPSVVAFTKTGERLVGVLARRQATLNPEGTVNSIKRFIGRRYSEVEAERKIVPYKVVPGRNDAATVEIDGKQYTPEQISSIILQKLKADAEAFLGEEVKDAVITVPAYFNDSQRQSTKLAGEIAGFNVLAILNEPTAASLAYGLGKGKNEKILVWDLGGGTFDVTVLEIGDGVFEVKATNGDTHLGGDDWDEMLVNYLADEFQKTNGIDLRKDRQALQRLREAAEKAKIELSSMLQTNINLPFITADQTGPKHLDMVITRHQFEDLTRPLLGRCVEPFKQALKDAKLSEKDLDEVVLVGGSTRMPAVQELVKKLTGKEPNKTVNPDEVVAVGAAIQAAALTGKGGATLPVLVDVTPLSLGVETQGGVMTVMIPRNTPVPTSRTEVYTTAADFQSSVEIHVLQGERPMARDNRSLGRFQLTNIPPAPKGVPQIEVTFDIDANNILRVSARDRATGKETKVTITGSTTLTKADVERMMRDAELHAEEDRRRKEVIEARHNAQSLASQVENLLKEYGDRIPASDKAEVEAAVKRVRELATSEDLDAIRSAHSQLEASYRGVGELIYRMASESQTQAASDEGAAASGGA